MSRTRTFVISAIAATAACAGPRDTDLHDVAVACIANEPTCGPGGPRPVPDVEYGSGVVLNRPRVYQVYWGGGTYAPGVKGPAHPNLGDFYTQLFAKGVYDWLQGEYGAGHGNYLGATTITPTHMNPGDPITDSIIRNELLRQIGQGSLPQPDGNLIFSVSFPKGKVVEDLDGLTGFCAYHGYQVRPGAPTMYYTVLPDISANPTVCGGQPNAFDDVTITASHELAETMTDPYAPIGGTYGWRDIHCPATTNECEIADLCLLPRRDGTMPPQASAFVGKDGRRYFRHNVWTQSDADVNPDVACTKPHLRSPQDVVWHSTRGYTTVYFDGDTAKPTGTLPVPGPASRIVAIGDFDGDGYDDVVTRIDSVVLGSFVNINWRGQTSPPPYSYGFDLSWDILGVGDFDGDGKDDMLWRHSSGYVAITFAGIPSNNIVGTISVAATPAIGDFNGDGKADVLWRTATSASDTFIVWPNGVPPATPPTPVIGPGADFALEGVGDFDGDGGSDLYFRSRTTGQCVIWYRALATRATQVGVIDPSMTIGAVGNFDNNTQSDLYVYTAPPNLQLFIYPGGNAAGTPRSVGIINADATTLSVAGVGKFDF